MTALWRRVGTQGRGGNGAMPSDTWVGAARWPCAGLGAQALPAPSRPAHPGRPRQPDPRRRTRARCGCVREGAPMRPRPSPARMPQEAAQPRQAQDAPTWQQELRRRVPAAARNQPGNDEQRSRDKRRNATGPTSGPHVLPEPRHASTASGHDSSAGPLKTWDSTAPRGPTPPPRAAQPARRTRR